MTRLELVKQAYAYGSWKALKDLFSKLHTTPPENRWWSREPVVDEYGFKHPQRYYKAPEGMPVNKKPQHTPGQLKEDRPFNYAPADPYWAWETRILPYVGGKNDAK